MATISYTKPVTRLAAQRDAYLVLWEGLVSGSLDGEALDLNDQKFSGGLERCVQFVGTFSTTTVVLQGSNDGSAWATLNDPLGTAISATATGSLFQVLESPRYIRPIITVEGTTPDIDCYLVIKGVR